MAAFTIEQINEWRELRVSDFRLYLWRDMRWLILYKSRYKCLIWIMYDRSRDSSLILPSTTPPHRPAKTNFQRFIANDIIMKFVIIPGAINRVIKAMCVCVTAWVNKCDFFSQTWITLINFATRWCQMWINKNFKAPTFT